MASWLSGSQGNHIGRLSRLRCRQRLSGVKCGQRRLLAEGNNVIFHVSKVEWPGRFGLLAADPAKL